MRREKDFGWFSVKLCGLCVSSLICWVGNYISGFRIVRKRRRRYTLPGTTKWRRHSCLQAGAIACARFFFIRLYRGRMKKKLFCFGQLTKVRLLRSLTLGYPISPLRGF
jgi:hypothetical protein